MKICYVTHLPNLTGATQSLLDMIAGLRKIKNIEVVVLIGKHGVLEEKLKDLNISYQYIPYSTDIKNKNPSKNKAKLLKNQLALPHIVRFLKEDTRVLFPSYPRQLCLFLRSIWFSLI